MRASMVHKREGLIKKASYNSHRRRRLLANFLNQCCRRAYSAKGEQDGEPNEQRSPYRRLPGNRIFSGIPQIFQIIILRGCMQRSFRYCLEIYPVRTSLLLLLLKQR